MDYKKVIKQIIDNPANTLTSSSIDLLETMGISIELDLDTISNSNIIPSKVNNDDGMNYQEKAKYLYNNFGKELAIKCVDELLNSIPSEYNIWKDNGSNFATGYNYYWNQVKMYIENIK